MKVYHLIILLLIIVVAGFAIFMLYKNSTQKEQSAQLPEATQKETSLNSSNTNMELKIYSTNFNYGDLIPSKYTCDGENINPKLIFENIPQETKSLVLIIDDPDAPMGTFTHWILFDMSPDTRVIEENSVPTSAKKGLNDFGKVQYGGPCPPSGTHRYFFRLYAISKTLNLQDGATRGEVEKAMKDSIIQTAEYMGKYKRL